LHPLKAIIAGQVSRRLKISEDWKVTVKAIVAKSGLSDALNEWSGLQATCLLDG
jgi:hypothetical protein